jgi:glycosyltransferase involved in cell wall biosynthesis
MSESTGVITHHLTSQARPLEYQTVVVIPAFNEESSIGRVVNAIPQSAVSEIIVVNNGSSDSTASVAREAGATVLGEPRKGYGYACLHGIAHAIKNKADIIAFMDGDNSDYPDELPDVIRPIQKDGYEMVIGSRMLGRREPGALLPQAIIGNWVACFLIRMFWGYKFTDLGPLRAVRTDALQKMKMSDPTFGWTVEMQIKAAKLKLKCTEVPVRYRKRIGNSKVTGTLSGTLQASMNILYTILKHLFARA